MTSGLHHITAITRKIQANVDFYVGFLGLRLVKRTAGFEDAEQLHLFYGDGAASPGSLVTFLAWEDGGLGRVGHGAPSEISFAISPDAIGFWLTRALKFNVKASGPAQEFGEPVLRLTDPDGIIVKLVGTGNTAPWVYWPEGGIPEGDAVRRLRGATILSEKPAETADFLVRHMGLAHGPKEGTIERLLSDAGDIVDVRDATGFWTAAPGTGAIDHVALRAPDRGTVEAVYADLASVADDDAALNIHDRHYFHSLYVREPGGTLIEFASDGPGFASDETIDHLGETLFIPAHFKVDQQALKVMLPQFGLPGEERIMYRDLPFVHRIHVPENPDGSTLVLLHGSGATETSLLPLGRKVAPNATLIGLRGRSLEEGSPRFFRRLGGMTFDQKDIVSEAKALAAFIEDLAPAYGVDAARISCLGYSNGANMLAAFLQLQPGIVRRGALLRPMNVLDPPPETDLTGTDILSVSATLDLFGPYAARLEERLVGRGASVTARRVVGGHPLEAADEEIVRDWLAGLLSGEVA